MGLFDAFRSKKVGGILGYLGLDAFWLDLTEEQRALMTKYYRSCLGADRNGSPAEGHVEHSSARPLNYLCAFIGWAVSDKQYDLADKIVLHCNKIYPMASLIDQHFYLLSAAEGSYRQKKVRSDALALAEKYALMDVELFPKYKGPLKKDLGGRLPRIPAFMQLSLIYEQTGRLQEAVDICKVAIKNGLQDDSYGGYQGRIEKIQKKIDKAKA